VFAPIGLALKHRLIAAPGPYARNTRTHSEARRRPHDNTVGRTACRDTDRLAPEAGPEPDDAPEINFGHSAGGTPRRLGLHHFLGVEAGLGIMCGYAFDFPSISHHPLNLSNQIAYRIC